MLNFIPRKNKRVFGKSTLASLRKNFMSQRARIAFKLQNPRLKRITFHTLRHFKATMEYQQTKDILHVKEMLGHRNINSTLIYTHLVNFESDEYHTATSKSLKRDEELLKAGFEYVTEREGIKLYRKRK
jgi:integrase